MPEVKPYPLAWPSNWPRTSVKDQKGNSQWKRDLEIYRLEVVREMQTLKAPKFILSTNAKPVDSTGRLSMSDAKTSRDVGVALYFERPIVEDFKWMTTLMLTGVPSEDDIEAAFRRIALPHHPDRPGGDAKLFSVYSEARELGKKWFRHQSGPPSLVIACDTFNEIRLNLQAVALSLKALRQLERCGTSQLLERTFQSMTTLIPEKAGV